MLSFRDNIFANPEGLIALHRPRGARPARVRPDQKVVLFDDWEQPEPRLKGTAAVLRRLGAHRRARQGGLSGIILSNRYIPI